MKTVWSFLLSKFNSFEQIDQNVGLKKDLLKSATDVFRVVS